MTEPDLRRLRELTGQACALARRLHDLRRGSDTEYVDQLNELRSKHGLLPIRRQGWQERRSESAERRTSWTPHSFS